jgi:hypothetical protein
VSKRGDSLTMLIFPWMMSRSCMWNKPWATSASCCRKGQRIYEREGRGRTSGTLLVPRFSLKYSLRHRCPMKSYTRASGCSRVVYTARNGTTLRWESKEHASTSL